MTSVACLPPIAPRPLPTLTTPKAAVNCPGASGRAARVSTRTAAPWLSGRTPPSGGGCAAGGRR
eukprot:113441-Alexandrium_andersonii.AAC.1